MTSAALCKVTRVLRPGNILQVRIGGTPVDMAAAAGSLLSLIKNGNLAVDCTTDNLENIKAGRHARTQIFRLTVGPGLNPEDLLSLSPGLDFARIL